jgi:ankyrin repeat protein
MNIFEAIKNGDLERVKTLILQGIDINVRDYNGFTPLMHACEYEKLDILKLLVEKGADVNAKDNEGNTTLIFACDYESLEIVNFLIENGADVNAKDKDGFTPLMSACETENLDILQFLIENGANVNTKNNYGMTPLMLASIGTNSNLEFIMFLVENGANVNEIDKRGRTALMIARNSGNNPMVINYLESLTPQKYKEITQTDFLKNYSPGDECGICFNELSDGRQVCFNKRGCPHAFHCDCIEPWLNNHSTCPVCRQPYSSESLPELQQQMLQNMGFGKRSKHRKMRKNLNSLEAEIRYLKSIR